MASHCLLGFFRSQLISLFYIGIFLQIFVTSTYSSSLYSPDDPLWEVDATNFDRVMYGKKNAWIMEFYNSWCGHCIRFAPTWKALARDIQTWKSVIQVAVMNCADSENLKLCQKHEVSSYPTIQLFWANVNKDTQGSPLAAARDVESIRHYVLNYLQAHGENSLPEGWPRQRPVKATNLAELWQDIPERINEITLIVEKPETFLGKEVIMDFSFRKHDIILRALNTNSALLSHLKNADNSSGTVVLKLERNGNEELLRRFPSEANDTYMRDQLFEMIAGYPRSTYPENSSPDEAAKPKGSYALSIYMTDLENAIRYTLRQEIGVHKYISGDKLKTLKSFLHILQQFFPGTQSTLAYLGKIKKWTEQHTDNVTGEDFTEALDEFENERDFIPEMREYIGCKGSEPRFRGYPCALWTLFHTLTIQSYDIYSKDVFIMKEDPHHVLFTISNYVKHFFTCRECSQHFQAMAVDLEQKINTADDSVLWLWNAHNKVNRRLAGDATEDPQHPKVQFPPPELCSKCQAKVQDSDQDIKWDTNAVLRFLLHYYGTPNIVIDDGKLRSNLEARRLANSSSLYQNSHVKLLDDNERDFSGASSLHIKFRVLCLIATFYLCYHR